MKKYYDINYLTLALLLVPTFLRKKTMADFAKALIRPAETVYNSFIEFETSLLIAQSNSQVCYMRAMINDEFDYYERRIIVRTAAINQDYYLLWKESNNKPLMISSANHFYLLNRDGQIGANNVDFEVVFPGGYWLSTNEIKKLYTLINANKLASKKYQIIYE